MALINYKLILLLNSLSEEELEKFRKFVSSPYYNKGRNYLTLLDKVIEYNKNPTDKDNKNNDSNFRVKISGKKLSDQTLRNRYSEIYKLGEEFLVNLWINENRLEKEKILLNKLMDKRLLSPYMIKYKETLKFAESEKFYPEKLKKQSEIKEINSHYLMIKNKEEILYKEYYEYSKIFFCYNLINLIELGFEFFQQAINKRTYHPNYVTEYLKIMDIDNLISELHNSDNLMFRMTAMNYYLYKAYIDDKNEEDYFISHKIFSEHFDEIEKNYKIKFFTILINYCISKLNAGNQKYKYELFKLYNEKLSQNLTEDLRSNSYTFNHFRDFVYVGIAIKDFEWVENFIEKYSKLLPPDLREDEIKISYAKLDFEKKLYERSLSNLKKIKTSHYLLYIDTSLFKLCNYYELDEFEESFLEMDKLKHYFRNNKYIPKTQSLNYLNFIKFYKKLIKLKTEPEKSDPGFLEKELSEIKFIVNRKWFLEKISYLKLSKERKISS